MTEEIGVLAAREETRVETGNLEDKEWKIRPKWGATIYIAESLDDILITQARESEDGLVSIALDDIDTVCQFLQEAKRGAIKLRTDKE